jgi:DNA-binding beta-propeller fold protein YncE
MAPGHDTHVNALCLILLGLAVLPLAGWGLVSWVTSGIAGRTRRAAPGILAMTLCVGVGGGCTPSPEGVTPLKESRWFSHVKIIGSRGMGVGQFSKPRSLAVDLQDNLYVTDMTGRVQKFAPDGTWLAGWQMPETEKGAPKGMCRDHQGRIVLVEPHYARVNHFEEDGTVARQWGVEGVEPGMLAFPRAAAVNSHGELYVSEYSLVERVQRFRESGGEFVNAFGTRGRGAGEFNRPEGLGIDSRDRVYVADSCNHRIQVFSREGDFLREYGRPGSGVGELSYPYDVRIDPEGTQFVCEFGNSRIQIFDAEGRSVERIGKPGAAPGEFANPWSLALDSRGNLYVADSMNHRVQKFVRRKPLSVADGLPGGTS